MTDNPNTAAAKQKLADAKAAHAAQVAAAPGTHDLDLSNSKPTPTQEENDLAKLGANVVDKEHDGSPEPDQQSGGQHNKQSTAKPQTSQAPGYQTRTARPTSE